MLFQFFTGEIVATYYFVSIRTWHVFLEILVVVRCFQETFEVSVDNKRCTEFVIVIAKLNPLIFVIDKVDARHPFLLTVVFFVMFG